MSLTFTVKVSGSGPEKIETTEEACKTTLDLKKLIEEKTKMATAQQKLVFKGKVLNDNDVLKDKKVVDKATIFLVKGVADKSSASSSAEPPKEEKKEDAEPSAPVPCKGECGFFGNKGMDGYCSKCFKDKAQKEQDAREKEEAEGAKSSKESAKSKDGEDGKEGEKEGEEKKERPVQENKLKCWSCSKKVGLTGIECRCGYVFCTMHRLPEEHSCDYDYKKFQRDILEKANKKVEADKLEDRA